MYLLSYIKFTAILIIITNALTHSLGIHHIKADLQASKAETVMYDYWITRNPFASFHAAALCNFGEATMGLAIFRFIEANKGLRAIPTRLEIEFIKKAKGTLKGVCLLPEGLGSAVRNADVELVTEITDASGDVVCRVLGNWRISTGIKLATLKSD